jgi:hypothetical protein
LEGEGAKPTQNPSYVTLFQAYPAQRHRPKTRNNPYPSSEQRNDESNESGGTAHRDIQEDSAPIAVPTPDTVAGNEPMVVDTEERPKPATDTKKKKVVVRKKKMPKVQPSIAAHIQPYNIVADLQQQRANITFGQLLQISPKLRSDVGKSL